MLCEYGPRSLCESYQLLSDSSCIQKSQWINGAKDINNWHKTYFLAWKYIFITFWPKMTYVVQPWKQMIWIVSTHLGFPLKSSLGKPSAQRGKYCRWSHALSWPNLRSDDPLCQESWSKRNEIKVQFSTFKIK